MSTLLASTGLLACMVTAAAAAPAPVIGGEHAPSDTAVVALAMRGGTVYCSGTLVSPRVVVTAGHCLYGVERPAYVFFGSNPATDGLFIGVDSAMAHPDYRQNRLADIGIVILARPVTIKPVALADDDLAHEQAGRPIRLVGFGDTEPADVYAPSGVKYQIDVPLVGVTNAFLQYGVGACHGDSGGATLVRGADGVERLAGVISRGDADCVVDGYSTRIDLYRAWVRGWIDNADKPSCDLDMRCSTSCDVPDPDCELVDPVRSPQAASAGCSTGGGSGLGAVLVILGFAWRRRRS